MPSIIIDASLQLKKHRERAVTTRKVKTGCKTCKIRRVKCDEGRPACSRCQKTGRVCDGYGIWGGGGNSYAERYGSTKSPSPAIIIDRGLTRPIGIEELRYLQWYCMKARHTVSGWFGNPFWAKIVLPATSTEPAILHAVIALSAAHLCEFRHGKAPNMRERFVLQQYSKAIHLLQSVLLRYDKASLTVVLIVCQIFTFLDFLRGKPNMAVTHLQNGLRLLKDLHSGDESSIHQRVLVLRPSSQAKVIDRDIIRSFANVHVQANLFGGNHLEETNLLLQPLEAEMPYPTFFDVEEAKDCLDKLLHGILLVSRRFQEARDGNEGDWSGLIFAQEKAMLLLTTWLKTYHQTTPDIERRKPLNGKLIHDSLAFGGQTLPSHRPLTREPLAYRLLLNYHAMATIMCKSLQPESETRYEAHTSDFISILEGSVEMFRGYLLARSIPNNVLLTGSVNEFGFIPPLYYTAIKCRNHRIRLHAIRLLMQIPHKEGVWDSVITVHVARKVMRLEEAGMNPKVNVDDDEFSILQVPNIDSLTSPKLSESSLFHDVQVDVQDENPNSAVLTGKRWRADGSLDVVRCHFDGTRWSDIR
ncbi:uncharacterized protein K460DRAFT_400601 [Cucurbitaria berberidis CBS 394.84]|uniref:Zn(2)-C6 fungal-type domain-containing protein n=1 Tax=Cucurbitaria berberidis CBS 394.84 TaxID=1168544 RepID=A0A9P4GS61_9PLEO|nr:uncharacterized protein K460DRAFT_400601 [Cucurbitaria berberidis CBS 394.84]KAF1850544.1 hypothetical protein K460DRAFT_400601 [Cucurbitaria berberidis CBS 394.84]